MSDNKELDLLMAKKMVEMKKRLAQKQEAPPPPPKKESSREIVMKKLVDRGEEVLLIAEQYYPEKTAMVIKYIAQLITSGTLEDNISGGELLWLFRNLGMHISVSTTIRVQKDGKFVSLGEKLKSEK